LSQKSKLNVDQFKKAYRTSLV